MPDISMCKNESCPSKNKCYRYTATPLKEQFYGYFPLKEGENMCDFFLKKKEYYHMEPLDLRGEPRVARITGTGEPNIHIH